jgi:hypothetical protein
MIRFQIAQSDSFWDEERVLRESEFPSIEDETRTFAVDTDIYAPMDYWIYPHSVAPRMGYLTDFLKANFSGVLPSPKRPAWRRLIGEHTRKRYQHSNLSLAKPESVFLEPRRVARGDLFQGLGFLRN